MAFLDVNSSHTDFGSLSFCPAALVSAESWWTRLEPAGAVAMATLLVALVVVAWATNLFALPGNWIAVALLALYVWFGPGDGRAAIGVTVLVIAFVLALIGELVEFMASAVGAQRAGASRRSTIFAVLGSMLGAIAGAAIGLPIPVIGSVLAAILFGGLGATAGAIYGEATDGRPWRESMSIGHAAFWGRTFGTLGKVTVGLAIVVLTLASVVV
jgi:hypothetical protein